MSEPLDLQEAEKALAQFNLLPRFYAENLLAEVHRLRTPSPVGTAPIEAARPPATNRYGLDVAYFTAELSRLTDSLSDRPPEELARYLRTLADAADPKAAARPEVEKLREREKDLEAELEELETAGGDLQNKLEVVEVLHGQARDLLERFYTLNAMGKIKIEDEDYRLVTQTAAYLNAAALPPSPASTTAPPEQK